VIYTILRIVNLMFTNYNVTALSHTQKQHFNGHSPSDHSLPICLIGFLSLCVPKHKL